MTNVKTFNLITFPSLEFKSSWRFDDRRLLKEYEIIWDMDEKYVKKLIFMDVLNFYIVLHIMLPVK